MYLVPCCISDNSDCFFYLLDGADDEVPATRLGDGFLKFFLAVGLAASGILNLKPDSDWQPLHHQGAVNICHAFLLAWAIPARLAGDWHADHVDAEHLKMILVCSPLEDAALDHCLAASY